MDDKRVRIILYGGTVDGRSVIQEVTGVDEVWR